MYLIAVKREMGIRSTSLRLEIEGSDHAVTRETKHRSLSDAVKLHSILLMVDHA